MHLARSLVLCASDKGCHRPPEPPLAQVVAACRAL